MLELETTAGQLADGVVSLSTAKAAASLRVWELGRHQRGDEEVDAKFAMLARARLEPAVRTVFVSVVSAQETARRYPKLWGLANAEEPWCVVLPARDVGLENPGAAGTER